MSFFNRFDSDMQANLFDDSAISVTLTQRAKIETIAIERAENFQKSYNRNATTHELAQVYRMMAEIAEQKDVS